MQLGRALRGSSEADRIAGDGAVLGAARAIAYPVAGVVAFLAIWWAWIELFVEPDTLLAAFAPDRGVEALWHLLQGGRIYEHAGASVKRIVIGVTIAAAVGVPLGLALGGVRWFSLTAGPVAGFIRVISPLSWTPLAIILFGVGDRPVYFLVAIGAVWPIALSTAAGVASLERQWLVLGRSLGATRLELMRTIVWPGIRADVLTGLRLGTGTGWLILVPAEMLGVDSGLGYFILDARDRFNYSEVVAAIILIGVVGLVIDRLTGWAFTPRRRSRPVPAPQPEPGRIEVAAGVGDYRI
ncbi:MAG: ABC transporter permease [Dehalococcoidia bacterium]